MPTREITTGLQKKTLSISKNFFKDIASFDSTKIAYEINLFSRVEKFFNDMNRLEKKEFRHFLNSQKYTTINNLVSCRDSKDRKVMMDVFHCLIALIIAKHSESDVLRYILPEDLRQETGRPEYSSDSWKMTYWFQILTYWFRLLFSKKQYVITTPIQGDHTKLLDAMKYIRKLMHKKDYIQLIKADDRFHGHLDTMFGYILGPILPMYTLGRTPPPTDPFHKTPCRFDFFINKKPDSLESVALEEEPLNIHKAPGSSSPSTSS